jgi:hypothetical protein
VTSTQQFSFEKAIKAEQRWSKLSLDVCHVCDGWHLTKMRKTMAEFGHTTQRQQKIVCGICDNIPLRNTAQICVIMYWMDRHETIHTDVPRELSDLTFAEKQLIALATSHMMLINLNNDMVHWGPGGHCVSIEQKISELFTTLPRKPCDLNLLNVRRLDRSSNHDV